MKWDSSKEKGKSSKFLSR